MTGIRIALVAKELDPPFAAAWDPVPRRATGATLVFVDTDEGLTGIGSGDTMADFPRFAHQISAGTAPISRYGSGDRAVVLQPSPRSA